jgi:nucleoside-diphosphate-sugar epimerase
MASKQPKRVLITGATGFIGGRLCEVLALTGVFEARAFVHSTASAWRIARFPLDFVLGDLCDRKAVDRAIRGCDAVIHLAIGHRAVMRGGLENLLRAAREHDVSRFVHMSSVAVYGNQPPAESVSESATARRTDLAYGNEKLEQEHRVLWHAKRYGLPVVILRPPNVYGPFSPFTLNLLEKTRTGNIAIVDGGRNPCNLVYIDNLMEATLAAIWKPNAVGEIFFVSDAEVISWEQCINDHAALVGVSVPHVTAAELIPAPQERIIRDSLRALPRVLLGKDFRRALRQIPAVKRIEHTLHEWFQYLSEETKQRVRLLVHGPTAIPQNDCSSCRFSVADNIIAAQGRTVAHSSEKARRLLGYTAPVSYREGMELTEAWLRYARII